MSPGYMATNTSGGGGASMPSEFGSQGIPPQNCNADTQCASGFCENGFCLVPGAPGRSCSADSQCQSGLCQSGACTSLGTDGQACTANQQCGSGVCYSGFCFGNAVASTNGTVALSATAGGYGTGLNGEVSPYGNIVSQNQALPYGNDVSRLATGHAPQGKTGPATVALMAAGAALGFLWMRRRSLAPHKRPA